MVNRTNDFTPKQQRFCRAVVSGCTMSDAYREAYNTSNMKPATVNREAHTLMATPKIATRVERLQRQKDRAIVAASLSDRERVLTKLRDLLDNAKGTPAESTMLRAADLLGKSVGLYRDVQVTEQPRSPDEIRAELEEMLAEYTDRPDSAVH
jgi:Asp/Glu/hydantoin racemase